MRRSTTDTHNNNNDNKKAFDNNVFYDGADFNDDKESKNDWRNNSKFRMWEPKENSLLLSKLAILQTR